MPYLTGGISIAVLAVGSTAPGLLEFAIGKFSALNPVRGAASPLPRPLLAEFSCCEARQTLRST